MEVVYLTNSGRIFKIFVILEEKKNNSIQFEKQNHFWLSRALINFIRVWPGYKARNLATVKNRKSNQFAKNALLLRCPFLFVPAKYFDIGLVVSKAGSDTPFTHVFAARCYVMLFTERWMILLKHNTIQ